uniref:TSA: Wollemia nobilis Ref_Wollemi_Transcript_18603_1606 transcribed RNA sequence n=1 Tax=Wollemia nobilis TaxID=56998 RepID=A0A0C9RIB6_9CONI
MGGEGKFVFHDFLGMKFCSGEQETWAKHAPSRSSALEEEIDTSSAASRLLSGPLGLSVPSSSDRGSERLSCGKWEGVEAHGSRFSCENISLGKKRDGSTSSLGDYSQDALDSSRVIKMSRFESRDERRGRPYDENVRLGMQPPRPSPPCQTLNQPSMGMKADLVASKRWDRPPSMNTGLALYSPSRLTNLGGYVERASANVIRENPSISTLPSRPPADEGSRTGLKGSGIANIVNNVQNTTAARNTSGQSLPAGRSKYLFESGVPESSVPSSHQGSQSASRQLTIFYAGQAHVFDDVPPSKADAIMALAGSTGRSWSTTYLPRTRSTLPSSVSEGHMPSAERDKVGSTMTNVKASGDVGMSPEFQTLLPTMVHAGHGGSRLGTSFVQLASDSMRVVTGGTGSKDVSLVPCLSTCSNEGDKETLCDTQQLV